MKSLVSQFYCNMYMFTSVFYSHDVYDVNKKIRKINELPKKQNTVFENSNRTVVRTYMKKTETQKTNYRPGFLKRGPQSSMGL